MKEETCTRDVLKGFLKVPQQKRTKLGREFFRTSTEQIGHFCLGLDGVLSLREKVTESEREKVSVRAKARNTAGACS